MGGRGGSGMTAQKAKQPAQSRNKGIAVKYEAVGQLRF